MSPKKPFRSALKHQVRALLTEYAPGAFARLQGRRQTKDPMRALSTEWQAPASGPNEPSHLHPVLSEASLLMLERPDRLDAVLSTVLDNEALDHVVDLTQMRQSAASVCFVVPVEHKDADALDRTIQSVLRQTDPDWELMLCSADESAGDLGRWLEIDWRVRRLTSPKGIDEPGYLKQAAIQATTLFIGLLPQGDIVGDDLVKSMGETLRNAPTTDLVYADEANRIADDQIGPPFYEADWSPEHQQSVTMVGRFVTIRKSLLLAANAPSGAYPMAAAYGLNLDVVQRARHIAHINRPLYIRAPNASLTPIGGFSGQSVE